MKCPMCDVELNIADRQGIEIDYCPQCRGVWLDRGELDKLTERLIRMAYDEDVRDVRGRRPDWDNVEEYRRYPNEKRKRKSLLGEIFDFD